MKRILIALTMVTTAMAGVWAQEREGDDTPRRVDLDVKARHALIEDIVKTPDDGPKLTQLRDWYGALGAPFPSQLRFDKDLIHVAVRLRETRQYERARQLATSIEADLKSRIRTGDWTDHEKARLEEALGDLYRHVWRNNRDAAQAYDRAAQLDTESNRIEAKRKRLERYRPDESNPQPLRQEG